MPTNKIALRSVEEFMAGYQPVYTPLYPQFLAGATRYPAEAGEHSFRRVETVGDIRAHRVTPKDTEVRQVSVAEGRKTYKRYFLANQFIQSTLQDNQGVDDVTAQVLDEHHVQFDEMLLLGEGTTPGTQVNNSLYLSSDPNYVLEGSAAELDDSDVSSTLYDFHKKVMVTADKADQVSGSKILILYGTDIVPLYHSLFPESARAVRAAFAESLPGYSIATMPTRATPSGANGWIIANVNQTKLHYTLAPTLLARGVNEEKMYVWSNFLMGSCMMEVLALGGIIRQPAQIGS